MYILTPHKIRSCLYALLTNQLIFIISGLLIYFYLLQIYEPNIGQKASLSTFPGGGIFYIGIHDMINAIKNPQKIKKSSKISLLIVIASLIFTNTRIDKIKAGESHYECAREFSLENCLEKPLTYCKSLAIIACMNAFDKLRSKGHRITNQRESILQKLKKHPQTVDEIFQKLNKNVNLASIYRTVKLFVNNGVVREVSFNDRKKRYELFEENNHHHHLICDNCGTVEEIKMREESFLRNIQTASNFLIKRHRLEFFGLCNKCI